MSSTKEMIIKLNPKIEHTIKGIQDDLNNNLLVREEKEENHRVTLSNEIDELNKELEIICKKLLPDTINSYPRSFFLLQGINVLKEFRKENPEYILLENQHDNSEKKISKEIEEAHIAQKKKLITIYDNLDLWWGDRLKIIEVIDAICMSEKEHPEYVCLENQFTDIYGKKGNTEKQKEDTEKLISEIRMLIFNRRSLIDRLSECHSIFNEYLPS